MCLLRGALSSRPGWILCRQARQAAYWALTWAQLETEGVEGPRSEDWAYVVILSQVNPV